MIDILIGLLVIMIAIIASWITGIFDGIDINDKSKLSIRSYIILIISYELVAYYFLFVSI